jgi:hypothetical protein
MTIGDSRLPDSRKEEFRIGRVVSRTFNAVFAHPVTFLALAALIAIPSLLLDYYLVAFQPTDASLASGGTIRALGTSVLGALLGMVFGSLMQAALSQGTMSWLNGEKPSFGQSLSVVTKNFLPLTIIAAIMTLGLFLGILLLIIPGIILTLMWSVVVPVRVIEGTSITESFSRSRALTRDYRGSIFLLFLAYIPLTGAMSLAAHIPLGVAMVAKPGDFTVPYAAVEWIRFTVLGVVTGVGVSSIYYELRLVKEGIGAQQMAAAFD